jgi:hypothetical protein
LPAWRRAEADARAPQQMLSPGARGINGSNVAPAFAAILDAGHKKAPLRSGAGRWEEPPSSGRGGKALISVCQAALGSILSTQKIALRRATRCCGFRGLASVSGGRGFKLTTAMVTFSTAKGRCGQALRSAMARLRRAAYSKSSVRCRIGRRVRPEPRRATLK